MPVSDEELQAKRERVENLRLQLAEQNRQNSVAVVDTTNDVASAQLDAEAKRLEVELEEARVAADRQADASDVQVASVTDPESVVDQGALDSLKAGEEYQAQLAKQVDQPQAQNSPPSVPPTSPASVPSVPVTTTTTSQGQTPGGGQ